MVNADSERQRQERISWRLPMMLMCKPFNILQQMGERPIEPSDSLFSLEFPAE